MVGINQLVKADVSRLFEELRQYAPTEEEELSVEVEDLILGYDFETGKLPQKRKRLVTLDVYELLDKVEEVRQSAAEDPVRYPTDFCIRCICADIAELAGVGNRVLWTGALMSNPDSEYSKRLNGPIGSFHN